MKKISIDKLIIVEGKYDKIKLENIVDADILAIDGFRIFNNKKEIDTIKSIARDREILIITDSDAAGYKIRVYLSKVLSNNKIVNVFVPQIKGKESRKKAYSAQGFLGVEGISDDIILAALQNFTCQCKKNKDDITVTDLYLLGLTGREGSKEKKNVLLNFLGVQNNISNAFLLKILNDRFTKEEFLNLKIFNNGDV